MTDYVQIDETDIDIKIPASYDSQPGKCLGFSLFVPVNDSESFSVYITDQKPVFFSFNGNILFEVSNVHILYAPFKCYC